MSDDGIQLRIHGETLEQQELGARTMVRLHWSSTIRVVAVSAGIVGFFFAACPWVCG